MVGFSSSGIGVFFFVGNGPVDLFINGQARSSGNEAMQVYSHEGWGGYVVLHIKAGVQFRGSPII